MNTTPDAFDVQAAREIANRTWLKDSEREAEATARAADLRAADRAAKAEAARTQGLAEAVQERARIASVVRAGRDFGKSRQAARLALLADIDAVGARAILASLPQDRAAAADALAAPSTVGAFGCAAAQAERRRIMSILSCDAAANRPDAAIAVALDTATDAVAAQALLSALPVPAPQQTLEERSREAGDFGADLFSGRRLSAEERSTVAWRGATGGNGEVFYG